MEPSRVNDVRMAMCIIIPIYVTLSLNTLNSEESKSLKQGEVEELVDMAEGMQGLERALSTPHSLIIT